MLKDSVSLFKRRQLEPWKGFEKISKKVILGACARIPESLREIIIAPGGEVPSEAVITPMKPPTGMLTRKELADRWRCSIGTIKRRERAGILHPVLLGARMPRYRRADIEKKGEV